MTELQYSHFIILSLLARASSIQDHFDSRGRRRSREVVPAPFPPRQEIPTVQIVAGIAVFSIPRSIAVVSKVIPSSGSF